MTDTYFALFVDTAGMRAWVREFGANEPPQDGCHSGQSYGADKEGCYAALRQLEAEGYNRFA